MVQIAEFIGPGDGVQEDDGAEGGLVVEELEAVDFVFALVGSYPDGVDAAYANGAEGEEYAEAVDCFDWFAGHWGWFLVVQGDEGDAEAHGDERVGGCAGYVFLVEEVYDGDAGGQEDSGDLVEGDC